MSVEPLRLLPLTKVQEASDLIDLAEELAVVDQQSLANQIPEARRWEYAMALRAIYTWDAVEQRYGRLVDVGGAGSPFTKMVEGWHTTVVDPSETMSLEDYVRSNPPLADVVTCLSVLEHVEDLETFVYHLSCLVAPGGLLFLTYDCWDQIRVVPDTAHFHWMRKRVFNTAWIASIADGLRWAGYEYFGDTSFVYPGHSLYGSYSVGSLALLRRS